MISFNFNKPREKVKFFWNLLKIRQLSGRARPSDPKSLTPSTAKWSAHEVYSNPSKMFMVSAFLYRESGIYTEGGETTPNFGIGVWPVALLI